MLFFAGDSTLAMIASARKATTLSARFGNSVAVFFKSWHGRPFGRSADTWSSVPSSSLLFPVVLTMCVFAFFNRDAQIHIPISSIFEFVVACSRTAYCAAQMIGVHG